jgi:hypothetical protein
MSSFYVVYCDLVQRGQLSQEVSHDCQANESLIYW